EDVALAREAHDIPDDEEIAGEVELLDDGELVRYLAAHGDRHRPVAAAYAFLDEHVEIRERGLSRRQRKIGELALQPFEAVRAALRDRDARRERARMLREQ